MNFISTNGLNELLGNPDLLIIDIRETYEREICALPSIHIPMGEIGMSDSIFSDKQQVVILCKSGRRAEVVANFLEKERGFNNLFVLEGGILAWIEDIDNTLETY